MTWEYVAGFFDGEGNICNTKGSGGFSPRWSVVQQDDRGKKVLEAIQAFLALAGIKSYLGKSRMRTERILWKLNVGSREQFEHIATKLMPYVYVKKLELQDTLRYLRAFPSLNKGTALGNRMRGIPKKQYRGKAF